MPKTQWLKTCYIIALVIMLVSIMTSPSEAIQRKRPPVKPTPTKPTPPPMPEIIKPPEIPLTVEAMAQKQMVIETSMGNITLEFYPQIAPNHVRQFIWLIEQGYFDGMSVSRVIPKFIIQSGNPASWADDNPIKKKRFEIPKLKAEYDVNTKHERGSLSMARPNGEPDGGTSHFFICTAKAASLDGQYTIFGHVVAGLEVIDSISAVPIEKDTADKPAERIEIKHITIKEKEAPAQ